jgi:hypothetical protein
MKIAELVDSTDVSVTIVKGGDHRLSSDQDLARLLSTVENMINK